GVLGPRSLIAGQQLSEECYVSERAFDKEGNPPDRDRGHACRENRPAVSREWVSEGLTSIEGSIDAADPAGEMASVCALAPTIRWLAESAEEHRMDELAFDNEGSHTGPSLAAAGVQASAAALDR